jgi:hypothetical protein
MIDQITFKNDVGETIDFNLDLLTIGPTDWKLPVHVFNTDGEIRVTKRPKPQTQGIFKSPTYIGQGSVHVEGDLLASTVEEANAQRREFKRIMLGDPTDATPPIRKMGDLFIDFMGETETYTTPDGCTIDGYPEFHLSNENPTVVPYIVVFMCFSPYLIGQTSGDFYWL